MDSCNQLCPFATVLADEADDELQEAVTDHSSSITPNADELYKPINHWQTRIISLRPGLLWSGLEAELLTVDLVQRTGVVLHDLQRCITYEALSYCWGSPLPAYEIAINGISWPIGPNLYCALQRLRKPDTPTMLWVDALCINQHDLKERSMQVQNMLSIYMKAERVLVWLGENPKAASPVLQRLANNATQLLNPDRFPQMVEETCPTHAATVLSCIEDLLTRPWFGRLWIRQEVWAASQITVHFGACAMAWSFLHWAAILATGLAEKISGIKDSFAAPQLSGLGPGAPLAKAIVANPVLEVKYGYGSSNTVTDIVGVIQTSAHCQCSDMRDRIYGVLGMTSANYEGGRETAQEVVTARSTDEPTYETRKTRLLVDYSKSCSQVFQDVVRYVLDIEGFLSVLLLEADYGGEVSGETLPSWCPNWSRPFGMGDYRQGRRPGTILSHSEFSIDGSTLHIKGVVVGVVTSVIVETTEEGGIRMYASISITSRPWPELELEVIGKVQAGDTCVSAARCHRPIFLRDRGDSRMYSGWAECLPWNKKYAKKDSSTESADWQSFAIV